MNDPRIESAWRKVLAAFTEYETAINIYSKQEYRHTEQLISERDNAIEWADKLASAIAPDHVLGEHSNTNDPWHNALEYIRNQRDKLKS